MYKLRADILQNSYKNAFLKSQIVAITNVSPRTVDRWFRENDATLTQYGILELFSIHTGQSIPALVTNNPKDH